MKRKSEVSEGEGGQSEPQSPRERKSVLSTGVRKIEIVERSEPEVANEKSGRLAMKFAELLSRKEVKIGVAIVQLVLFVLAMIGQNRLEVGLPLEDIVEKSSYSYAFLSKLWPLFVSFDSLPSSPSSLLSKKQGRRNTPTLMLRS